MKKIDLTGKAYHEIKSRIAAFKYLPGYKLSDGALSRELNISRTPIREALNRLTEQGILTCTPNKGCSVKIFTKKEMQDLFLLREALEILSVELAINNFDKKLESELRKNVESYPALIKNFDLYGLSNADEKFHERIAFFSGNQPLYEALNNISLKIRIIRRSEHMRPSSPEDVYQEHNKIFKCIKNRDVSKAKKVLSDHIREARETLSDILPDSAFPYEGW